MPECFEFKEDDISLKSVWVTLPSLSLECWHPNALGKIGSRLGTPIAMDSLTMKMERVSYARILVEVDASKKLIEQVEFVMQNGITRKQPVVYEFTPKFYIACNRFGHLQETCQGLPAVPPIAIPAAAPVKPAEATKTKLAEWTVVHRRNKGKALATAAKPTVEAQQPTSPPASKVEQGRLNMKAPQPLKLKDKERLVANRRSWPEGSPPLYPHEDWFLESWSGPTWYELKDFVDCCVALGLLDVPTKGYYYTWYSNNESNPVWCKLDRVLYNSEWLEADLHCSAHFNPSGCLSDHSPGIVSIFDHAPTKPKPFRFFNMWVDHPDFLATVEARWNLSMEGTPQFSLCRRLKAVKGALKVFNKQHYSHISGRAKEAELALHDAQNQLESNRGDVVLRDSLGDLRKKAIFLAEAEQHFFYQKAKIYFLKEGDRNTKFLFGMVKRNVITAAEDIPQEFVDYYTSPLGTEAHTLPVDDGVFEWGPLLSPEHTVDLFRAVTLLEVKDAIFHISDNKAPGSDGYSSCFFKKAWNIVGDQVCRAVLDFFRSGRMLRQLNHTIIVLVPKSDHSTSVADYRPISCCNVIYKAITKIISERLAPALEHLIDRCQAAFVRGCNITDNIFLAQEMVRQYSRKWISPRCTINVDLRKAFDSISWTFLSRVLHRYGFSPLFISWIMECICNSSFSVALNGSLHGFFSGKKGLRQGDPMSPALFLLSMEYFSRLVKRKTSTSDFNFHPKCEKLKITHLLFADDLMLFSRGDLPSIHVLMELPPRV
ncbi:UNVERIFIED_CONTAM: Retrovirus-related Pol polyprotein from type-2 retrotransposable element R2DM [Sesamum indicum]